MGRSYQFSKAIIRHPASSVVNGLRDGDARDPNYELFQKQHQSYAKALAQAGAQITALDALESYPDSVFVEDTTLCLRDSAIILRPGAASRYGEAKEMRPFLEQQFARVINLPGNGFIDGGDILLSDQHAFIGLSARTNIAGLNALASLLNNEGYEPVEVKTPADILHFKTECGLLDEKTIFATAKLAALGCFNQYKVIIVPQGEEAAANIVRYNDVVMISKGHPKATACLRQNGYQTIELNTSEAAKIDGGLSCMSLRF